MDEFFDYEEENPLKNTPSHTFIEPGTILHLSKENVGAFHERMRSMILEGGYGMFEYLEAINFFSKLKELVSNDEKLTGAIVEEIRKYGKTHTTPRGVKFELGETGVQYDYSNSEEWVHVNSIAEDWIKERKAIEEKLKKIPPGEVLVDKETGVTLEAPVKTSKSSFKVTLPK